MTVDAAIDEIGAFRNRLDEIREQGLRGYRDRWAIIQNDIEEWAAKTFDTTTKDFVTIHSALHPGLVSVSVNEWQDFLHNRVAATESALLLVDHRLRQGQALVRRTEPEEHLVSPGTPHSAYVLLRDMIEGSSQGLFLIDPYIDRSLFPLLSNVRVSVATRILTRRQNLPSDFGTELSLFSQQTGLGLEVRCGIQDFHDRFLVADDLLLLSGASFKDLGKKGSVVTEIKDIKRELLGDLESRWATATAL